MNLKSYNRNIKSSKTIISKEVKAMDEEVNYNQ